MGLGFKESVEYGERIEEYERLRQELLEKASELVLFQGDNVMTSGSANEHAETIKALEQIFPKV